MALNCFKRVIAARRKKSALVSNKRGEQKFVDPVKDSDEYQRNVTTEERCVR
jgi:hypothetical protein